MPDAILRKPAKLNDEEWAKMKLHPLHGQKILRNIKFLEGAARVVGQHHERWDGEGYPYGIRGEEIDIGARILRSLMLLTRWFQTAFIAKVVRITRLWKNWRDVRERSLIR